MTRSVKVSSWLGPAPAARSRSRPRRSRSRDSCWPVHGSASSTISLASRLRAIPVQIRWDKAVRAHPDVTIKIVPHGHLHDRSGVGQLPRTNSQLADRLTAVDQGLTYRI